jgi:outer membrane scaffolding protein for murein synthesis (MipA/OmpV family)
MALNRLPVRTAAGLVCCLPCWGLPALAQDAAPMAAPQAAAASAPSTSQPLNYAVGLAVVSRPAFAGSGAQQWKLRPLWTVKWGRFRLSGPRASGLLGRPGDEGSGASAELAEGARWRLGASLGVDGGRRSADDPRLAGLPDIARTVRGKLFVTRDLAHGWGLSMHVSEDLAGRGGGLLGGIDLGLSRPLGPGLRGSVGAGLSLADGRSMRRHFGIDPAVAAATGRAAHVPGAGLRDLHVGGTLQWAISGAWFGFVGAGLSQLQGDASSSPLVLRRQSTSLAIGLAWRNLP